MINLLTRLVDFFISTWSGLVDFFLSIWSGLVEFIKKIIPLIWQSIVVLSPFVLICVLGYDYFGFIGLAISSFFTIFLVVLGFIWSKREQRALTQITVEIWISIAVLDIIMLALVVGKNNFLMLTRNHSNTEIMAQVTPTFVISHDLPTSQSKVELPVPSPTAKPIVYINKELYLEKVWFNDEYTDEQRGLFFLEIKGKRLKFDGLVSKISVAGNSLEVNESNFLVIPNDERHKFFGSTAI